MSLSDRERDMVRELSDDDAKVSAICHLCSIKTSKHLFPMETLIAVSASLIVGILLGYMTEKLDLTGTIQLSLAAILNLVYLSVLRWVWLDKLREQYNTEVCTLACD